MIEDLDSKFQLKSYISKIADINYFNDKHKIIRIEFNSRFYDFKVLTSGEVPNPNLHLAVVITSEESLSETKSVVGNRLNFLPGIKDSNENLVDLPIGFVYIISKKQTLSVTNSNSGSSTFAISKTNMSDIDNVSIAISPPTSIDYTNTDKDGYIEDKTVGLFINKDNTILIKSQGSSITMGKDGIHLGGKISFESEAEREWMADNTFHRFIPSTMVTAIPAIPNVPNISRFANIATAARKVRTIIGSISSVQKIIKG